MHEKIQSSTLSQVIRTLNNRDFDRDPMPISHEARAELLAQCAWAQNALDRWRSAIVHAPSKPSHARAAKAIIMRELVG